MADTHVRDSYWQTDLIWHYFHDVQSKAAPRDSRYQYMDPLGELSNRHRVYELLVDESAHTYPPGSSNSSNRNASKIPWNQTNAGFVKAVGGTMDADGNPSVLWCGSLIKIVFMRYMGWSGGEPKQRSIKERNFDAVKWTIEKLKNKIPVRAFLGGHHYVGIVGHHSNDGSPPAGAIGPRDDPTTEFLCLDPWAYGIDGLDEATYAGTKTAFLGVIRQRGTSWTYGKGAHIVSAVEA